MDIRGAYRATRARVWWDNGELFVATRLSRGRINLVRLPMVSAPVRQPGPRGAWIGTSNDQILTIQHSASSCGYTLGGSTETIVRQANES